MTLPNIASIDHARTCAQRPVLDVDSMMRRSGLDCRVFPTLAWHANKPPFCLHQAPKNVPSRPLNFNRIILLEPEYKCSGFPDMQHYCAFTWPKLLAICSTSEADMKFQFSSIAIYAATLSPRPMRARSLAIGVPSIHIGRIQLAMITSGNELSIMSI